MKESPKKKFGGKTYKRTAQGYLDKLSALRFAKMLRGKGYKARVVLEHKRYRIYWA